MMWIPVVFVCLANVCGFVYDVPVYSESKCEQALKAMQEDFDARPEVTAQKGTCIPASSV
jgi:hypothetical protein